MKTKRIISAIICAVMIVAAFAMGFTANADGVAAAGAVKFSITANGSTFTITRSVSSGTLPAQQVIVRTVDVTALSGEHYTGIYDRLAFTAGETSKTVTVSEKTSAQIPSAINRYQYGTVREYRLEVLDLQGFLLGFATRQITYGTAYRYQGKWIMAHDGEMLAFLDWETVKGKWDNDYLYPNDIHLDVNFPGTSSFTRIQDMDGNGYTQATFTVSTDALFARTGCAPREYFEAAGDKMYATIIFTGREYDDGYQYIQVLADNTTDCDGKDDNGTVNTVSTSVYKMCFELNAASGSTDSREHSFMVPHRYDYAKRTDYVNAGLEDYTEVCDSGKMWAQKYRTTAFKASNSGSLVLSPTVNTITVRFNARGSGDDDFAVKDIKARLAIVDLVNPSIQGVSVSQGPNQKHNRVTITAVYNEIVQTTGSVVMHTTWGDLTAEPLNSSTYANAIAFTGEITANAGTQLRITGIEGTVTDLHGLVPGSFTRTFSNTYVGSTTTPSQTNGAYSLTCQSDLYWFNDTVAKSSGRTASAILGNDVNMFSSNYCAFTTMCPNGYAGTFDGNGHALSNLTVAQGNNSSYGLFSLIDQNGTVRNLTLDNSCKLSAPTVATVGGIAGLNAGTIEKCAVNGYVCASSGRLDGSGKSLGGIAGRNDGTIRYCLVADSPSTVCVGNYWNNMTVGGLVGTNVGTLTESIFYGKYNDYSGTNITRGSVCGNNSGTITNCPGVHDNSNYFNGAVGTNTGTLTNVTFPEIVAFTSGEICYTMNNGVTDGTQVWYQTLSTTEHPTFTGLTVYAHGQYYVNAIVHDWVQTYNWTYDSVNEQYTVVPVATCSVCGLGYTGSSVVGTYSYTQLETCIDDGFHQYTASFNEPTEYGFTTATYNEVIPAYGHDIVIDPAVAPTCTQTGHTQGEYCTRCDYVVTPTVIAATGHTYIDHEAQEANCTDVGWNAYRTCAVCDYSSYVEIPALGHDLIEDPAVAATCTETGLTAGAHCSRCEYVIAQEITPAKGHHCQHYAAQAPTCTSEGWDEYDLCIRRGCDYCTKVIMPALGGHLYTYTDNLNDLTHNIGCERCNYRVTEEHTYVNGVCTVCGAPQVTLGFYSVAPVLNEKIDMIISVSVPRYMTNPYIQATFHGETTDITYCTNDGNGHLRYVFTDINPQCIGDPISIKLYATADGSDVVKNLSYSVRDYCISMLYRNDISAELRTLLSDMLAYGAAAQVYAGYETNDLVTSGNDINNPTYSTFTPITGNFPGQAGASDSGVAWSSVGLTLNDDVAMRFRFYADSLENLTARVIINGRWQNYSAEDFTSLGNNLYELTYDGIKVDEFDKIATCRLIRGNVVTGTIISYSVNTYIQAKQNDSDPALQALVRALYNYGASAIAYEQSLAQTTE